MSTPSLSRLTKETMANYRLAAAQVVAASGAGSRRLVQVADVTLQTQLVARTSAVAPRAGERFDAVRGNVRRLVDQGIDQVERAAEISIERSGDFASAQLTRLADFASEVKAPVFAEGLHTAARLSIPAAQLALRVSSKVAEGATALADVAGAHPVRRKAHKTAKKAAKGATKSVRRGAVRATRGVNAKVKAAARRRAA